MVFAKMINVHRKLLLSTAIGIIGTAVFTEPLSAAPVVQSYSLVSSVRSGRTTFDYTYRPLVRGDGDSYHNAAFAITSTNPSTQVINNVVNIGDLDAEQVMLATNTFTIRQDRLVPFDQSALHFAFSGQAISKSISWTPNTLSDTIGQGQTKTEVVSFVSDNNLANVTTWIAPELQPFLTITPNAFSSVSAGTPQAMTITFSASSSAPLNTFTGTLHLLANASQETTARPIPITLTICQCVATKGISLKYPSSPQWHLHSGVLELGGPISLNNFDNAYQQGGIVPSGGAEIDITTIPLPTTTLPDFIAKEVGDATIESKTTITVSGETATQVVYTDLYAPSLIYKNIAVYVPHQALLYKLYLSYRDGDKSENEFLTAFKEVLDSVKFTL
jgi:hypothetical protein